jgi:transposase
MGRAKTPSFIVELPLMVTDAQQSKLQARFSAARQVYNACLGESLRRLNLKRESKAYQKARRLPKKSKADQKARQEAFKKINESSGFREYDLHSWAKQFTETWLNQHLDSLTVQKLASRAFKAVQDCGFGKKGKPRFKGKNQFDSVEGKTNKSGLLWRDNQIVWSGMKLPAIIDDNDEVIEYGLSKPVKYVRLVRRKFNGKAYFYAQLVCEGKPYRKEKHKLGKGKIGLDLGPSTIAGVSEKAAFLLPFCADIDPKYAEIRRLQRQLDRQRRANNPDNYEDDGTITSGKKQWHISNRMQKTRTKLSELHRKQTAHRKSLQGQLVNIVLSMGDVLQLEKISYKAWQKNYGRSIGRRAPSLFVETLKRKAESAGAEFHELPTWQLCLSQICHGCGNKVKKPLSQRQHQCECGVSAQRDLYSAFLAMCVENNSLDADHAKAAWSGVETLLRMASSDQNQLARARHMPSRVGDKSSAIEPVVRIADTKSCEAQDVVP